MRKRAGDRGAGQGRTRAFSSDNMALKGERGKSLRSGRRRDLRSRKTVSLLEEEGVSETYRQRRGRGKKRGGYEEGNQVDRKKGGAVELLDSEEKVTRTFFGGMGSNYVICREQKEILVRVSRESYKKGRCGWKSRGD